MDCIDKQAAVDLFPDDTLEWDTYCGYIAPHFARKMISDLPSVEPAQHYCRECRWGHSFLDTVDDRIYWRCLNWDGGTDEEGFCHEWEKKPV